MRNQKIEDEKNRNLQTKNNRNKRRKFINKAD